MSDIASQGDLIDIYYILPQEHKCIRDIGIVESTNSLDYVSLLGPEILKSLVVKGIIYVAEKLVKIIPAVKTYIIKGSWPIFFSKLLNYDEKVRNHLDKIALSTQIGPTPPSTEIYKYATKQLWSIHVTYSEALRADRLSTFIDACKRNENLIANICIADPELQLPIIAETEINAIYGKGECEKIQTYIINNGYKSESITKFLYPYFLDYTRKLNDTYAALSLLKIEAEKENVDSQINFYTYKEKPTLRATYIYGKKKILDFVYFPENWIGMTGTMFRCEVLSRTTLNNKIFKMAEDERRNLDLNQRNDLMDTIENKLNENLKELGLDAPSFKANITKDNVEHNRVAIEKKLKDKSSNNPERQKFLGRLAKMNRSIDTQEPKIIVLPHK